VLVTGEVALALVLLVGAGLMGRSLRAQLEVDPGFDAEGLLVFRLDLPSERYPGAAEIQAAMADLTGRLRAGPGVSAVAFSSDAPLRGRASASIVFTGEATDDADRIRYYRHRVGPGWFDAMGIDVRSADAFAGFQSADGGPFAVISRAMAERHYGSQDPIGRTITLLGDVQLTVVGVAEDVRHRDLTTDLVFGATDPDVYLPWGAFTTSSVEVVLRSEGDPAQLAPWVRDVVRAFDPALPPVGLSPMTEVLRTQTAQGRFGSLLLASFSGLAALLAAVGLYGVLAFTVARRGREIAVRMAVGADRRGIRRLVLRDGLRLSLLGVAIGVVAAAAGSRALTTFLFGVTPVDGPTYAAVAALMVGVAALASWIPAVRATRVDPQRALAGE
jgi:predicted permease